MNVTADHAGNSAFGNVIFSLFLKRISIMVPCAQEDICETG